MNKSPAKKRDRIRTVLAAAFFSILCSFAAFAFEADIAVNYGFMNSAGSGMLLPVDVTVMAPGSTLTGGYVVVEVPGDTGNLSYTSPVELADGNGEVKFVVTIPEGYTGNSDKSDELNIRLLDENGEEIASKQVTVTYTGNGRDAFTGIISADPDELGYFKNVNITGGINTRLAYLSPAGLPETAAGLSQLDILILSGINARIIPDLSAEAILSWVKDGGTLILGCGAVNDPLGVLGSAAGFSTEELPEVRDVDMGMQYSVTGPDGAVIELAVRSVTAEDAEILNEYDGIPVILRKAYGRGRIAVTAFDLSDIGIFCAEHPEYAADLLRSALGPDGIRALSARTLTGTQRQQAAKQLTNVFEGGISAKVSTYLVIAVWYLALSGGVLYILLKSRGLSIFYSLGVFALSLIFGFGIWILSANTRTEQAAIHYAACFEPASDPENGTLTVFMDIVSPDTKPLTLNAPAQMTILPESASGSVSISCGKTKMLAVSGQKQFVNNIFTVNGPHDAGSVPVTLSLSEEGGGPVLSVTNRSEKTLSNAFVLLYDRLIFLGDLKPGATARSSDVRYCPTALSGEMAASLLKGAQMKQMAQKESLLSYELFTKCGSYFDGAVFFAFTGEVPDILSRTSYDLTGSSLVFCDTDLSLPEAGSFGRSVLYTSPGVISGSYDALSNTISGAGQTVLEYSLGSGKVIGGLRFRFMDASMESEGLKAFDGQIGLFNYENSTYDPVESGTVFAEEDLKAYLSPSNTTLVKYVPGGDPDSTAQMFLPVPEVTSVGALTPDGAGGPDA